MASEEGVPQQRMSGAEEKMTVLSEKLAKIGMTGACISMLQARATKIIEVLQSIREHPLGESDTPFFTAQYVDTDVMERDDEASRLFDGVPDKIIHIRNEILNIHREIFRHLIGNVTMWDSATKKITWSAEMVSTLRIAQDATITGDATVECAVDSNECVFNDISNAKLWVTAHFLFQTSFYSEISTEIDLRSLFLPDRSGLRTSHVVEVDTRDWRVMRVMVVYKRTKKSNSVDFTVTVYRVSVDFRFDKHKFLAHLKPDEPPQYNQTADQPGSSYSYSYSDSSNSSSSSHSSSSSNSGSNNIFHAQTPSAPPHE